VIVKGRRISIHSTDPSVLGIVVCTLLVTFSLVSMVPAQDDSAPPPLKMLSKTERQQLKDQPKPKDHTNLALGLMDARLRSAEKFSADENYSLMYAELGGFEALMDNALKFLLKATESEGKHLDDLKRFEIGLRRFVPRVETIRRDLPANFDPYLKTLIRDISDAREQAMKPFYSDSVVSDH
jgi:hypothetical protein